LEVRAVALLLKNGRLVDPGAGVDEVADMIVRDGRIVEIGQNLSIPKGQTIECAEKIVVPGLVDLHTHLREPGREDEETVASGTRAAAHGGFTAVCAMPNTLPICDTGSKVRFLVERAAETGVVRVHPVGSLTAKQEGEAIAEIGDMVAEGAVAFSDDGRGVQDAGTMRRVMDYAKAFNTVVVSHCEDESLAAGGVVNEGVVSTRLGLAGWPAAAEEIAVARDIRLAELTGCRLHLAHLSTAGSVELVRVAKARGLAVTAEVTPHHLFLDEDAIGRSYDTNLKMNPPLRTAEDREVLVRGIAGRHDRLHCDRPCASRTAREGARVRARAVRHHRTGDRTLPRHHPSGGARANDLVRRCTRDGGCTTGGVRTAGCPSRTGGGRRPHNH
jgi:dihydroorotase